VWIIGLIYLSFFDGENELRLKIVVFIARVMLCYFNCIDIIFWNL